MTLQEPSVLRKAPPRPRPAALKLGDEPLAGPALPTPTEAAAVLEAKRLPPAHISIRVLASDEAAAEGADVAAPRGAGAAKRERYLVSGAQARLQAP